MTNTIKNYEIYTNTKDKKNTNVQGEKLKEEQYNKEPRKHPENNQ